MNLGAVFIGLAILIIAVPYVISPLVNEHKKQPAKALSQRKDEQDGQKNLLSAIRDLDFDFQTGKVTQEDYETLRAQLIQDAGKYLQLKQEEDEKIEAMILARRQQVNPTTKCEKCGAEIFLQDQFCPSCGVPLKNTVRSGNRSGQRTCPGCGKSVQPQDLFCTACGSQLSETPATVQTVRGMD